MGAAWALDQHHEVTLFESRNRLGGHSNTVEVSLPTGSIPVDTGFIVYNEVTYPHLTRLFATLGVATEDSDMSFSFSVGGGMEYGATARGLVAQPGNLLRRRYRRMVADILRFKRIGVRLLDTADGQTIGELLERNEFSEGFIDDYLLPMTGAIWSTGNGDIRSFPADTMLRFLANHGLIQIVGRPQWRTVTGGSREYIRRLTASLDDIRVDSPVDHVERSGHEVIVRSRHGAESFDHVVIAAHTDQAIRMLGTGATPEERYALGSIPYASNRAVLHSDPNLMPDRRAVWSSWNAIADSARHNQRMASVTYWMNRLQNLETSTPLFVSLNPTREPDPSLVHGSFDYAHPQFGPTSTEAQEAISAIQGRNRTWFAGAYCGYGFHEDGLQAGFNVAAALGSPPPWFDSVVPMSSSLPPSVSVTS